MPLQQQIPFEGWAATLNRKTTHGKQYWRSLEELAAEPRFREYLAREFPENVDWWSCSTSRRKFLTLMGAFSASSTDVQRSPSRETQRLMLWDASTEADSTVVLKAHTSPKRQALN